MPKAHPEINATECKGCGRCVEACPKQVLALGDQFNARGYRVVRYAGDGCIGCGQCFYACPEPYTIRVVIPLGEGKDKPDSEPAND